MTRHSLSLLTILVAIVLAGVIAYEAYRVLGWMGVGLFGLLATFIAVQAEMDDAAPIGGTQNTGLYASSLLGRDRLSGAEKAALHAEATTTLRVLNLVKVIGACLAVIGMLGFFLIQFPH